MILNMVKVNYKMQMDKYYKEHLKVVFFTINHCHQIVNLNHLLNNDQFF
jgi:hypothetical protein